VFPHAARLNPYTTSRKVYAEGARVGEVPLPKPSSALVEQAKDFFTKVYVRRNRRRMFRRLNYCAVPGYAPLCMDTNDPETLQMGLRQRVLRDVPLHADLTALSAFVYNLVRKYPKVQPMSFEGWLQSTNYSQSRMLQLRTSYAELRGGPPCKRDCHRVKGFGKTESYPCYKHARSIHSRTDHFKVFAGPMIKAIENVVYDFSLDGQHSFFIKHVPIPDRPMLIDSIKHYGMKYYSTDYTAYESHFLPEIMDCLECQLYRWCLSEEKYVDLLCDSIMGTNKIHSSPGFSFSVDARRMSGEMSTSLGNGFSNMCVIKFICFIHGVPLDGFVEGDDGVFATPLQLTAEMFSDLGFTMKHIEEVIEPAQASFCGMLYSPTYDIIKDPRRFFMNFGWTHSCVGAGTKTMDALLRAKALSTVYEAPQCPIVGALARYALLKTVGVVPRFEEDGYHIPHDVKDIPDFHPTNETRVFFDQEFNISPDQQVMVERDIMNGKFDKIQSIIPPDPDLMDYAGKYLIID